MGRGANAVVEKNVLYGHGHSRNRNQPGSAAEEVSESTQLTIIMPGSARPFLATLEAIYTGRELDQHSPDWQEHHLIDEDTIKVRIDAETEEAMNQFEKVANLMLPKTSYEIL